MNVLVPIGQPMGFRVPTFQLYTPSAGITHQPKSGWQPLRLSSYSNSQKMPKNWKPRNYGKNICRIICTIPYHPGNTCVSSGLHGLLFPRKPGKKRDRDPRWTPGDHWTTSLHPCVSSEHHLGADTSELQTTEAAGAVWFTSFATACFDIHLKFFYIIYIYN